jgi:N-acetylglucosamine kinase-like BadF-type ATPase
MILIADSGSTKTKWILVKTKGHYAEFETIGLNPFYISSNQIAHELNDAVNADWCVHQIDRIFFYGAGCASIETEQIVAEGLSRVFHRAEIAVFSDVLGAARALFRNQPGIAVILGTGASSCDYNGTGIENRVPALGYILGDDGSGAVLGKELLKAYWHQELPEPLQNTFSAQYNLEIEDVKRSVYSGDRPNRYLASFTPFLLTHIGNDCIRRMVGSSFDRMYRQQVKRYPDWSRKEVRLMGSIAFYFADILNDMAVQNHIKVTKILRSPILELAEFHAADMDPTG